MTVWTEIVKDVTRVREFVAEGKAEVALAILIDEDGRYAERAGALHDERFEWGRPGRPGSSATVWLTKVCAASLSSPALI